VITAIIPAFMRKQVEYIRDTVEADGIHIEIQKDGSSVYTFPTGTVVDQSNQGFDIVLVPTTPGSPMHAWTFDKGMVLLCCCDPGPARHGPHHR
jgi:hypothetical protein